MKHKKQSPVSSAGPSQSVSEVAQILNQGLLRLHLARPDNRNELDLEREICLDKSAHQSVHVNPKTINKKGIS